MRRGEGGEGCSGRGSAGGGSRGVAGWRLQRIEGKELQEGDIKRVAEANGKGGGCQRGFTGGNPPAEGRSQFISREEHQAAVAGRKRGSREGRKEGWS